MIEVRDRACDEALLDDHTVTEDYSVEDASKGTHHGIVKLLLDALWLS